MATHLAEVLLGFPYEDHTPETIMLKRSSRYDRLLCVDLELTCWEDEPPAGERSEILEIAIVEIDNKALTITRQESFLCKPKVSSISPYCQQLTGITEAMVKRAGRPLGEVCNVVRKKFGTRGKPWCAWGYDDELLREECALKGVEYPFSSDYLNLALWGTLTGGSSRPQSLQDALRVQGIDPVGRAHSGLDDALNTAAYYIRVVGAIREREERRLSELVQLYIGQQG